MPIIKAIEDYGAMIISGVWEGNEAVYRMFGLLTVPQIASASAMSCLFFYIRFYKLWRYELNRMPKFTPLSRPMVRTATSPDYI